MLQRVRELAVQYKNGSLSRQRQRRDPVRGQPARVRDRAHRLQRRVQRHQAAELGRRRSRSRSAPTTARSSRVVDDLARRLDRLGRSRWRRRRPPISRDRRRDRRGHRASARSSARCRTASSTRLNASAIYQENLIAVREPHPRRGHGRGDGRLHEAPDPAAGRDGDARAGQPAAPDGPVAPARLRNPATRRPHGVRWRPDSSELARWRRPRHHRRERTRGRPELARPESLGSGPKSRASSRSAAAGSENSRARPPIT